MLAGTTGDGEQHSASGARGCRLCDSRLSYAIILPRAEGAAIGWKTGLSSQSRLHDITQWLGTVVPASMEPVNGDLFAVLCANIPYCSLKLARLERLLICTLQCMPNAEKSSWCLRGCKCLAACHRPTHYRHSVEVSCCARTEAGPRDLAGSRHLCCAFVGCLLLP